MTKAKMYKVLITIATSNYQVMDILQAIANDNTITSAEFFDLFTYSKERTAELLGTPASLRV